MEIESKDPALGTITENRIKVPLDPEDKMVKATEKPHKGNPYKLAIWILSVIVVALIALLIFLAFCPISPLKQPCPDTKPDDNNQSATDCPACEVSAEDKAVREIVGKVKQKMSEYLIIEMQSNDGQTYTVPLSFYKEYDETFPTIKPEGSAVYVRTNRSYGFRIDVLSSQKFFEAELSKILEERKFEQPIADLFAENGFEKVSVGPDYNFFNSQTGVVCTGVSETFACSSTKWVNQDDIKLYNQLATAFEKATDGSLAQTVYDNAVIENSNVEPYQRLSVSAHGLGGGGHVDLYYRTSPESEWQYFTGTQAVLPCSDYNTEDLRKAFAGDPCDERDTVKP